jgi:hypothetical protein
MIAVGDACRVCSGILMANMTGATLVGQEGAAQGQERVIEGPLSATVLPSHERLLIISLSGPGPFLPSLS